MEASPAPQLLSWGAGCELDARIDGPWIAVAGSGDGPSALRPLRVEATGRRGPPALGSELAPPADQGGGEEVFIEIDPVRRHLAIAVRPGGEKQPLVTRPCAR